MQLLKDMIFRYCQSAIGVCQSCHLFLSSTSELSPNFLRIQCTPYWGVSIFQLISLWKSCWYKNKLLCPSNCYLWHFFIYSTKQMGSIYVFCDRPVTKCLKVQFKTGSYLIFLLCADTRTLVLLSQMPLLCLNNSQLSIKWIIKHF